jgi:L-lactate utilization protein LutC
MIIIMISRLRNIAEKLLARGYEVQVFNDKEGAKRAAIEIVGGGTAGFGGSVTVDSLGIYEELKEKGNKVSWHWKEDDKRAARETSLLCDCFFSSVGAITESGQLVNIDGTGNRCASLIFGPKRCVVIVGKNKIVSNYDEAIKHIKTVIGVKNARRQGTQVPCAVSGKCCDCSSPQRMCSVIVVHERPPKGFMSFDILLVDEELGL